MSTAQPARPGFLARFLSCVCRVLCSGPSDGSGWSSLALFVVVAVAATGVAAGWYLSWPSFPFAVVACMTASFAVGSLLGLLFGIPRVNTTRSDDGATKFNNNLADVADWLAKTIIAVSLTQWNAIGEQLTAMAETCGPVFAPKMAGGISTETGTPVAFAAIIFFLVAGFMTSYLVTVRYLTELFDDVMARKQANAKRTLAKSESLNDPHVTYTLDSGGPKDVGPKASINVTPREAADVAEIDFDALQDAWQFANWARAKAATGAYRQAQRGYRRALDKKPENDQWRRELAAVEIALGDFHQAVDEYRRALEKSTTPKDEVASLEGLLFAYLYLDPPDGFRQAIAVFERYSQTGRLPLPLPPSVYARVACAYGQKHAWLTNTLSLAGPVAAATSTELEQCAQRVVEFTALAIKDNTVWRPILRQLRDANPDDRENDLASLKNNAALASLLDHPAKG